MSPGRAMGALLVSAACSLAAACGSDCPPPAVCPVAPAPAPAAAIDVGPLLDGFARGGNGSATLTIPGYGETTVSLKCSAVTSTPNTPAPGKTQVKLACTFSKFPGISGNVDVTIEIDRDGKGSITASGSASVPLVGTQNINVSVELNGGSQTGSTISLKVSVNGGCSDATIKREGDDLIIEVVNPVTKIKVRKR